MRYLTSLGCVIALLGLGMMGCDDDGGTDGGTDAGTDTGPPTPTDGGDDAGTDGGPPPGGDLVGFGADLGALTAADFACRGTETEPGDGVAEVTFNGAVEDFFTGDAVVGVTVWFYPDNVVSVEGTCTGTCAEAVSDASGAVSLMDNEGSWFGYRVLAGSGMIPAGAQDYIDVLSFNNVTPATGADEGLIAVQASTVSTITAVLGSSLEPGTAFVSGRLRDCNDEAIANATVRMFDSAGEIDLGSAASGPRAFYFNGDSFPLGSQRATHVDGLFGGVNIPVPTDNAIRVEVWGVITDGGPSVMLSCEEIRVMPDGLSAFGANPSRSDGPSGCSG